MFLDLTYEISVCKQEQSKGPGKIINPHCKLLILIHLNKMNPSKKYYL